MSSTAPAMLCEVNYLGQGSGRFNRSLAEEILQALPIAILQLDVKGCIAWHNPFVEVLLGRNLVGYLWRDVIEEYINPQADDGHEVTLRINKRVWLQTFSLPHANGQIVLMVDMTTTRQYQDSLSHQQRLMALGEMLAKLAHQLRTPITTALLYSRQLQQQIERSKQIEINEKLIDRLHAMEQIIRNMLIYAKQDHAQFEMIKMQDFVQQIGNSVHGLLNKRKIKLQIDCRDNDVEFCGNHVALSGALINLIENAEYVTPANEIIVLQAKVEDHEVIFQVKDKGTGIQPDDLTKVFEPFYTTSPQGTGLGLPVAQAVARVHQGEITLESKKSGTLACLRFPWVKKMLTEEVL